jgi:hypothetical protein
MARVSFKKARLTMAKKLREDLDLRESYKANIAMAIYDGRDKSGRVNATICNKIADDIINKCWSGVKNGG